MFFGKAVEQLDAAHQQVTVGGMGDGLGLHGRIERHALHGPLSHGPHAHRHAQRFCKQEFELVPADPPPPASHRRTVEHQPVAEVLLPAEVLEVRVFHPTLADRPVGQPCHVFEQVQSRH